MTNYKLHTLEETYSMPPSNYSPSKKSSVPNRQQAEAKLFWKAVELKKNFDKLTEGLVYILLKYIQN